MRNVRNVTAPKRKKLTSIRQKGKQMADYLAGSIKNLNTLLGEQLLDGSGSGGGGGTTLQKGKIYIDPSDIAQTKGSYSFFITTAGTLNSNTIIKFGTFTAPTSRKNSEDCSLNSSIGWVDTLIGFLESDVTQILPDIVGNDMNTSVWDCGFITLREEDAFQYHVVRVKSEGSEAYIKLSNEAPK